MGGRKLILWSKHIHVCFNTYLWGCIVLLFLLLWCWLVGKYIHTVPWGFSDKKNWCRSTWSAPLELKLYCWIIMLLLSDLLLLWWTTLDIWWDCRQLWGNCNTGHILEVNNTQQYEHILHLFLCSQVYCYTVPWGLPDKIIYVAAHEACLWIWNCTVE